MLGNNTIRLNKATMLAAMQLWLDANFKTPPKAENICYLPTDGGVFELTAAAKPAVADRLP